MVRFESRRRFSFTLIWKSRKKRRVSKHRSNKYSCNPPIIQSTVRLKTKIHDIIISGWKNIRVVMTAIELKHPYLLNWSSYAGSATYKLPVSNVPNEIQALYERKSSSWPAVRNWDGTREDNDENHLVKVQSSYLIVITTNTKSYSILRKSFAMYMKAHAGLE